MSIFSKYALENEWHYHEKRGDQYRQRALALLETVRHWRTVARVSQAGNPAVTLAVELAGKWQKRAEAAEARLAAAAERQQTAEAENAKLRAALMLLNRLGGLGYDKHAIIDAALAASPGPAAGEAGG